MKAELLETLRCPASGQALTLAGAEYVGDEICAGELVSEDSTHRYPITNCIPRFVPQDNYAVNFGIQWNLFRETQLDSVSGVPISHDRFYRYTGWTADELRNKRVLDVGCGAGRFTEIALKAGARVVAIDYSGAVDACWANHANNPALDVVQADIYRLPFAPAAFDYVYCLGVLQHTPDVRAAFAALPKQLGEGGHLAVDLYPKLWLNALWPKYWLRPVTKHVPSAKLFSLIQRLVPLLLPMSTILGRVPLIGTKLRHAVPVVNYEGVYPLSAEQLYEWAVLDTFDMLAPAHDHPQSAETLTEWFSDAHLQDVTVERMGFLVGRGTRRRDEGRPADMR